MQVDNPPISRMGLSLFVILFGSFLAPLLMHSSTLAIPAVAVELSLSAELVSWFTLIQVLSNACFVLPAGKLADLYGRKRIFCTGLYIAGFACFIGGFADDGISILVCRMLQGVGTAFIFASAVALVMSAPPDDQKVRVMGIYIAIAYLGIVTGPVFGGYIIEHLDWRWVFFLPGLALILVALIGNIFLHWERYGDRSTRLRGLDTSLYMAALILIAVGVFDAQNLSGQLMLVGGVASFSAFFWFQSKRRDPLLQVKLFIGNPIFTMLGIAHFLTYCGILALPFTLTLYLQYIKALDAQTAGFILLSQAVCTVIVAPFSGWLSDRIRARHLIFSGMLLFVCAELLLAFINANTPIWLIILPLCMIGASVGLMDSPILHTSMKTVDEKLLGSASATMNMLRTMGGFVSIGIVSYLMGRQLGDQEIKPHLYDELMLLLQQFFAIAAGIAVLALALLIIGVVRLRR